jgi:hypothetical protein
LTLIILSLEVPIHLSDAEPVGLDFAPVILPIANGRVLDLSLDKNGVTMVSHV